MEDIMTFKQRVSALIILLTILLTASTSCALMYKISNPRYTRTLNRPAYQSDGIHILLSHSRKIYRANLRSGQSSFLAEGEFPVASHDGNLILYLKQVDKDREIIGKSSSAATYNRLFSEIWIMDSRGNNQHKLYEPAGLCSAPFFSADGSKVYYIRTVVEKEFFMRNPDSLIGYDLYALDLKTRKEQRITFGDYIHIFKGVCSPDGKRLYYQALREKDRLTAVFQYSIKKTESRIIKKIGTHPFGRLIFTLEQGSGDLFYMIYDNRDKKFRREYAIYRYNPDTDRTEYEATCPYIQPWSTHLTDFAISPDLRNILFITETRVADYLPLSKLITYEMGALIKKDKNPRQLVY